MALAGVDGATLIVAESAAVAVVALAGWGAATVQHRRRRVGVVARAATGERIGVLVLVAVTGAGVVLAPVIGVFSALVLLNHTLGLHENVPFARYAMFSQPREQSWALRYEDGSGGRVNVASLGIMPPAARKRFAAKLLAERAKPGDLSDAHERAAGVVVRWIDERRPSAGPLATEPITIVLVEYEFDGAGIQTRRRALAVARPS